MPRSRTATPAGAALAVCALSTACSTASRLAGHPLPQLLDVAVGAVVFAIMAAAARRHRAERRSWSAIVAGVGLSVVGAVVAAVLRSPDGLLPVPSLADVCWLARYPLLCFGVLRLTWLRSHPRSVQVAISDALIGAGAVGAAGSLVVAGPIMHAGLGTWQTVFRVAYPLGDLVVAGCLVGAVALSGWRMQGWSLLSGGLLCFAIAESTDSLSGLDGAAGTGAGASDPAYLAAALLLALAARQPAPAAGQLEESRSWKVILLPGLLGGMAVATLVEQAIAGIDLVTVVCATASLVALLVRQGLLLHENTEILRATRIEARTDQLTGLGNRRALVRDLTAAVAAATPQRGQAVAIFDLNGFKLYNDRFGHQAGDALLARLAMAIETAVGRGGTAYRIGGDEFCVLIEDGRNAEAVVAHVVDVLSLRGAGFEISTAAGFALIPGEAHSSDEALRVADNRMYAHKDATRSAVPERHVLTPLLALLRERDPGLGDHTHDVATMCAATARELECDEQTIELARVGGELHDVGKMAIPDAILHKPGPLTDEEWTFMRRHTVIGERILASDPSSAAVAPVARHHHENYDGTGYPDGLRAGTIPVVARIVSVCDAYEAMVADRAYRPGRSHAEAVAELQRCAGTQFDPAVVAAFLAVTAGQTLVAA